MENKNIETIKQRMIREGFSIINEYDDPPGAIFPDHGHPGDQFLVVVRGSIEITMNGKTLILKAGEEYFFPAEVMHSAKMGPSGCLYIDGEKPTQIKHHGK